MLTESNTVDIVNCTEQQGVSSHETELPEVVAEKSVANAPVLYPNPASEVLRVDYGNKTMPQYIEIMDINGRVLKSMQSGEERITTLQIRDLPSGIYYLKSVFSEDIIIQTFAKK